jgi:hypothetical protein
MLAAQLNSLSIVKSLKRLVSKFQSARAILPESNLSVPISDSKERQVSQLQEMSIKQVEQALAWLDSPVQSTPPEELQQLNPVEWMLLEQLLQQLLLEKEQSRVQ